MNQTYPILGYFQPKKPLATDNLNFGRFPPMREIDPKAFGLRVLRRRRELKLSQGSLGKLAGYSQSRIDGLEKGQVKRPDRNAATLADALQTTREWLLWEEGAKDIGPVVLTTPILAAKYEDYPRAWKLAVTQFILELEENAKTKRQARS